MEGTVLRPPLCSTHSLCHLLSPGLKYHWTLDSTFLALAQRFPATPHISVSCHPLDSSPCLFKSELLISTWGKPDPTLLPVPLNVNLCFFQLFRLNILKASIWLQGFFFLEPRLVSEQIVFMRNPVTYQTSQLLPWCRPPLFLPWFLQWPPHWSSCFPLCLTEAGLSHQQFEPF